MSKAFSLSYIANKIGAELVGKSDSSADFIVTGVNTLTAATNAQISFLANPKYQSELGQTKAAAVIVNKAAVTSCPGDALYMDNPYVGFAKAAQLFSNEPVQANGIHASATVSADAKLAPDVKIGANCVISAGVKLAEGVVLGANSVVAENVAIAKNTTLKPNVTIYHGVQIGANCLIHSGTVIGSDGFGLANDKGEWLKIPQVGKVVIQDNVEIGANCTIDRGALDDTEIHHGVKLDNQIQIAHNVVIGANTAIAAKTGIAGSTKIGKNCIIGGAVGINGHLTIADGVMCTGMCMVTKSISKPGVYASGIPAREQHVWHKNIARYQRLDKLMARVKKMENKLNG